MRFVLPAVLCLSLLSVPAKPASALDKPTLEAFVRHLLGVSPEVQIKIEDPKPAPLPNFKQVDVHLSLGDRFDDETFYVSADGKNIIRGYVYDVAQNPFQSDLEKLHTVGSPSYGPANAPVTIVVFGDFECPYCRDEAKTLRQNVPSSFPTQVRVVFKNFPLTSIHPWAKPAAIAGRCVYEQSPDAFWKFHDWIYDNQDSITQDNLKDKVLDWAKGANIDALQFGRCLETQATAAAVDKDIQEGRELHIEATPTTFINGRRLGSNYPWPNLASIIEGELKYAHSTAIPAAQDNAKKADDSCCSVSLPAAAPSLPSAAPSGKK